jgi:hypothetical protein
VASTALRTISKAQALPVQFQYTAWPSIARSLLDLRLAQSEVDSLAEDFPSNTVEILRQLEISAREERYTSCAD